MLVRSQLTHELYNEDNVVYFRNIHQAARYCYNGCPLLDLIPTDDDKFVFVFGRKAHEAYKHVWQRPEEGTENVEENVDETN